MKITKFEELNIWKLSLMVIKKIYDITARPPFNKDFNLRYQIRRAVISISSNIVEGFEKNNNNEFIRYLKIAKGSIGETRNHLYISSSIGYVSKLEFEELNNKFLDLANQVGAFISYLEKARKAGKFSKTR